MQQYEGEEHESCSAADPPEWPALIYIEPW
jgi:hypothetical protein